MRSWRDWIKRGALAALACAGAVTSFASAPVPESFEIDAEAQYMLDVNIRQLRLGDGVRGYSTPQGSCLLLGDMVTVLDVPIAVDLKARTATGWAFREDNILRIDRSARTVAFGKTSETLDPAAIRDSPEGWCVDSAALGRWLGISVKVAPFASVVTLDTAEKLPVELSREREMRSKHLKPAALPLEGLPQVKLAYRMWRAPALDFIVSAGATYEAGSGLRVDRRASVRAAGEIAHLSYDASITSGQKGALGAVRIKAFRSDPEGGLLGPLNATHFALGDVPGPTSRLIAGGAGRGAEITNRPLFNAAAFDRTRFEGDLAPGWEAELYRNGQLLAFAKGGSAGRYLFDDVQLDYGENRFEIITYGPQGQQRSRVETINIGQSHVPPGDTYHWLGANQPGSDLLGFVGENRGLDRDPTLDRIAIPKAQAAISLEHGLDKRTSVAALAATMLVGDEKLTFVEGSVRRSVGPVLLEVAAARQFGAGTALRGSALARIGAVNLAAEAVTLENFFYQGRFEERLRDGRLSINAPLASGKVPILLQGDIRYLDRDDRQTTRAGARVSANLSRVNLTGGLKWERQKTNGAATIDRFDLTALASGRLGPVRLRGSSRWEIAPESRLRNAELSAYWSASDNADWEVGVGYEALGRRTRGRISHIRRFNALAAAASVEASSDGAVAVGLNLNFSLDGSRRGFHPVRDPLASVGQVRARIFRDDNDNGRRDPGEPLEQGAMLTAGTALALEPSGTNGIAAANGLAAYRPVAIGIDASSLSNPALGPRTALKVIVPRPGVTATIDIPLVGAGDIEGALVKDDGSGLEGLDVELVDREGRTVATARTDYDGFFLFERVAYGRYSFRLTSASATAAGLAATISAAAEVSGDKPVARIGALRVTSEPKKSAPSAH
ncbi:MAG TPA: carboxypeptidase-like regulatory domain-containing protein [Sphingomicrobium sp.]|nr:carboxypeptidase-like regulatory domain-containing protein [Sphingomicrobium sp.]